MQMRVAHSAERAGDVDAHINEGGFRLAPVAANDDIGPALEVDCLDGCLSLGRMLALDAEREYPE